MTARVATTSNSVQVKFHIYTRQEIQERQLFINKSGAWKVRKIQPKISGTVVKGRTDSILSSVEKRCTHVSANAWKMSPSTIAAEFCQHWKNSLVLQEKVIRHVHDFWDWIPLIGPYIGEYAENNVKAKFARIFFQILGYIKEHAHPVFQELHKEVVNFFPQERESVSGVQNEMQKKQIQGVFTQFERIKETVCEKHVKVIFEKGVRFGFYQTPTTKQEVEVYLDQGNGIEDPDLHRHFVFWRETRQEPLICESFCFTSLDHATKRILHRKIALSDSGKFFHYDYGFIEPLVVSKDLPDFPDVPWSEIGFAKLQEIHYQSKMSYLLKELLS